MNWEPKQSTLEAMLRGCCAAFMVALHVNDSDCDESFFLVELGLEALQATQNLSLQSFFM